MYECPNCGSNLKFDIPSQLLKCDYCQTTQDPYDITKAQDAEENDEIGRASCRERVWYLV